MMRHVLVLAAVAAGGTASAQAPLPEAIAAFTRESIEACRSAGGSPSLQGLDFPGAGLTAEVHVPYLTEAEFNGDGVPDYVTDLAGLECANAWSFFCGSAGCPVTVWLSGPGGHTAGWGGHAQEWRLEGGRVVVALHGQLCTPPRAGFEGCEVALDLGGTAAGGTVAAAAPSGQRPRARPGSAPPAVAAPALPSIMGAPAAGWTHGQTADGAGWFAGVDDPESGGRVDWLCAKGRQSLLALRPHDGGGTITIDVDGRVQSFEVQTENGTAYAPVAVASPLFLHIASGQAFSILDAGGAPVARFTMQGAPSAIGQAEGRCPF